MNPSMNEDEFKKKNIHKLKYKTTHLKQGYGNFLNSTVLV